MANTQKTSQVETAKQLLSNLTAGKKAAPKTEKKATRPEMPLPSNIVENFQRMVCAHDLMEKVEARELAEKEIVNGFCYDFWVENLWKTKNRPANPVLRVDNKKNQPDCTSNFIVADKFTFNLPEVKDNQTLAEALIEKFIELFKATGMDQNEAEAAANGLVNNEFDLTPRPNIDFFRWLYGHYEGEGKNRTFVEATPEEQALGAKALAGLQCQKKSEFNPLSPEELSQLIELKNHVQVKKGFLERVCAYVHSLEQLKIVFMVAKPIFWQGQIKFAVSDTPEEKNRRLAQGAADILGVQL
jgi:hypothetical protein